MDGVELLPVEIAEALERGATVVTGNQRAARALRRALDRRNRALGLASWAPAAVMAWDAWTGGVWRELLIEGHATQLLLNRTQEHAVWRTVLEADEELDEPADRWIRWRRWRRRLGGWFAATTGRAVARSGRSADTRAFQRWALAFERSVQGGGVSCGGAVGGDAARAVEAGSWMRCRRRGCAGGVRCDDSCADEVG